MQRKTRSPLTSTEHDVAVIGGGFSGAATAVLLKRLRPGLRVIVIEATERFDRKVGESAIELSSWFLTKMLDLDRHLALDQLPKYGLRFWFSGDRVGSLAEASELGNFYQTRVPSYHIDRAALDEHVLRRAVDAGANLLRPARVLDADLREGDQSTLLLETPSGHIGVTARWIVDATGRKAWLARRLGLLRPLREHPTRSIWARYSGTMDFDEAGIVPRNTAGGDAVCSRGLSTNHLTGPGWWIWAIPLPGGELSVGLVWDERLIDLPPGDSIGKRFDAFLDGFPAGRELIGNAQRVKDDLHAINGLAYGVDRLMGDGWALVGDASGFIDPFYSMGLDWASLTITKTVELIAAGAPGAEAIADHNTTFTTSFRRWFRALYRDKYFYMGDLDLMEVALRLEVPMYYLGVVTPPYRDGAAALEPPFGRPVSLPFYLLMRLVHGRLVRIGRARLRAGTWGRHNAGRRVLLPGFKLGPGNLLSIPGVLARLAVLEARSIPDRFAAWRRGIRHGESGSEPERAESAARASTGR